MSSIVEYPTDLSGPCHHIYPVEGSEKLLVIFGAKDLHENRFNFLSPARELGENLIVLNNGSNQWYQFGVPGLGDTFLETVNCLQRWRDSLGAKQVYAIGTSMGGYAAVQYGSALNAATLAFSTDAKLGARHSRSTIYYTGKDEPSCPDLGSLIAAEEPNVTLVIGERDIVDIHAADQLNGTGEIATLSLLGCGHHVPSFLSRRARLGPMLRAFVADRDITVQKDAGRALAVEGYADTAFAAHCAFEEADWGEAEVRARDALMLYPGGEAAEIILGQSLVKQNRYAEAMDVLARTVAGQPEDADLMTLLATAMRKMGAGTRAKQVYLKVIELQPNFAKAHYGLGLAYLGEGYLPAAVQSFVLASRTAPRNRTYRDRLVQTRRKLQV